MSGKRSLICGFGVNDADYYTQTKSPRWRCPYYQTWHSMLNRCYNEKHLRRQPAYLGCSVCGEWHKFSVFKAWMIKQDWEGKELDKDLLVQGNKVYGPETCVFVSGLVNKFITTSLLTTRYEDFK